MRRLPYTPDRLATLRYIAGMGAIGDKTRFAWAEPFERAGLVEYYNESGWRLTPAGRDTLDTWEAQLRPMGEGQAT